MMRKLASAIAVTTRSSGLSAVNGPAGNSFGLAELFAKEIDANECGYDNRGYHGRAANFFEGESKIVARHETYRERRIRSDADRADCCHYVQLGFHVAHHHAPQPNNSAVGG